MAEEKKDAKPAAKDAPAKADDHGKPAKSGGGIGGMLTKLPVLLGGVMLIEAVVLFAGFKFLGGGTAKVVVGADLVKEDSASSHGGEEKKEGAHGEEGKEGAKEGATAKDKSAEVEIVVVEMKAPNKMSGKTFLYDVASTPPRRASTKKK